MAKDIAVIDSEGNLIDIDMKNTNYVSIKIDI